MLGFVGIRKLRTGIGNNGRGILKHFCPPNFLKIRWKIKFLLPLYTVSWKVLESIPLSMKTHFFLFWQIFSFVIYIFSKADEVAFTLCKKSSSTKAQRAFQLVPPPSRSRVSSGDNLLIQFNLLTINS